MGIARNTVRTYLRHPELAALPHPRPNRHAKLDPFKEQVQQWIKEDHCYHGDVMFARVLERGDTGSLRTLNVFVHPLRPPASGHSPIVRYETKPGEQVQFDWGAFKSDRDGQFHTLSGFSAMLCSSRMRFVTLVTRCETATMIRCLMEACEYVGGVPQAAFTDRMKSVL